MKFCLEYHSKSDQSDFCSLLDAYLMDRFGYKTSCVDCSNLSPTVNANRNKFDLYLRIFEEGDEFWGGKALVISRMGFDETRRGHGTDLLRLIVEFAQERQYDVIGIEQAGSPSIQRFADKHGFQRMEDTKNYTASVKELGLLLNS